MYLESISKKLHRDEYLISVSKRIGHLVSDLMSCGAPTSTIKGMVEIVVKEGGLKRHEVVEVLQLARFKAKDPLLERTLDRIRP